MLAVCLLFSQASILLQSLSSRCRAVPAQSYVCLHVDVPNSLGLCAASKEAMAGERAMAPPRDVDCRFKDTRMASGGSARRHFRQKGATFFHVQLCACMRHSP